MCYIHHILLKVALNTIKQTIKFNGIETINKINQAQASDQYGDMSQNQETLINRSKTYFQRFLATNNKYFTVNAQSTLWINIWAYRTDFWNPLSHSTIQSWYVTPYCGPKMQDLTQTLLWVKDNILYVLFHMVIRT